MAALTFHGSGNDDRWRATLRAESPIATDTAWINLCGARIACLDGGPAVRVAIEPACEADSAHAHLWRRPARSDPEFDREPPQATIDALIASGALAVDDPMLTQLEAVRRRLPHPDQRQTRTTGFRALPDPWPSLIGRRGRTDGPTGLLLVAAETPTFGGHQVVVDVFESGPERFTVAARESPRPGPGPPFRGPIDDHELVWWAREDRDNRYLAARYNDELRFTTALDPLATALDLMPTAVDCRAVISFSLQWAANGT